jgi:hypothetical protein
MGYRQVTMVFNPKMVVHDLDDVGKLWEFGVYHFLETS